MVGVPYSSFSNFWSLKTRKKLDRNIASCPLIFGCTYFFRVFSFDCFIFRFLHLLFLFFFFPPFFIVHELSFLSFKGELLAVFLIRFFFAR